MESASDPALGLSYNDLPNAPSPSFPANQVTLTTASPTLKISQIPSAPNGDEVLVQFQISDDENDWSEAHVKHESGWIAETSYMVPAGELEDGETYFHNAPRGQGPLTRPRRPCAGPRPPWWVWPADATPKLRNFLLCSSPDSKLAFYCR